MAEIKGRTAERRNATIELLDGELLFNVKGGFLGGKDSSDVIPLEKVTTIESGTGVQPYQDALMLKVNHVDGVLDFYSIHIEPLEEVIAEINRILDERARDLAEKEAEFLSVREANVALLVLDLELIDSLFELVQLLRGSVDWEAVETTLKQMESISEDRLKIPNVTATQFSALNLAGFVEKRLSTAIRDEVFETLEALSQGVNQRALRGGRWFPSVLHQMFTRVSLLLWSFQLTPITRLEPLIEVKDSQNLLNQLHEELTTYLDEQTQVPVFGKNEPHEIRATLYLWTELLMGTAFSIDKE